MKILFHVCCSNCALYSIRILQAEGHDLTGFWYNPNIHPLEEYGFRLDSLKKLSADWQVKVLYNEEYNTEEFFEHVSPSPERCRACYALRLEKTAAKARDEGFEAFSTTLLISPYQDFDQIAITGQRFAEEYSVTFYLKDLRPYFRESMNLARKLGFYRQKYCGCIYSKEEKENAVRAKEMKRVSWLT